MLPQDVLHTISLVHPEHMHVYVVRARSLSMDSTSLSFKDIPQRWCARTLLMTFAGSYRITRVHTHAT